MQIGCRTGLSVEWNKNPKLVAMGFRNPSFRERQAGSSAASLTRLKNPCILPPAVRDRASFERPGKKDPKTLSTIFRKSPLSHPQFFFKITEFFVSLWDGFTLSNNFLGSNRKPTSFGFHRWSTAGRDHFLKVSAGTRPHEWSKIFGKF